MPASLVHRRRAFVLVLLVALAVSTTLTWRAVAQDDFAGWPPSWVEAYRRFEVFNATRKKYFPASGLEISPAGEILHSVPLLRTDTKHIMMDVYRDGRVARDDMIDGDKLDPENYLAPDTYAIVLRALGPSGYQHLYPMVWIETGTSEGGERTIKMVAPPEPAEDYWPNERIFNFLDYAIFRARNPSELHATNMKVEPRITLQTTNSGTVVRKSMEPAQEKLLQWRIYHNGRLVEKGKATGRLQYPMDRGPGSYAVFVGVEGPAGFMPVSNFLEFPLFPEEAGGHAVFPTSTNRAKAPDFLLEIVPPDPLHEALIASASEGLSASETYNSKLARYLRKIEPNPEAKKRFLVNLWITWSYDLSTSGKQKADAPFGRILDNP